MSAKFPTNESKYSTLCRFKGSNITPKISSYTLDTFPQLTPKQRKHLETLSAKPDSEINFSDIPELTEAQLAEMKPLPA